MRCTGPRRPISILYPCALMANLRQFEFFDRFAPSYDDSRLEFALEDIRRSPPGTLDVLDVGCGNGATLEFLANGHPLASIAGFDPSATYIERARARLNGDFEVGSILDRARVTARFQSYDRVVVASVMHHLVEANRRESKRCVREALVNCLALLRPGGRLYVFEPITEPAYLMTALFWAKSMTIHVVGNRRIEIGPSWANIGAPLVSFLGHEEFIKLAYDAGAVSVDFTVQHSQRYGPVRRRNIGYIISR